MDRQQAEQNRNDRTRLSAAFVPPTLTATTTTDDRHCNSRASAVEPPQGKLLAAHSPCWRQLSRGPRVGGAVRIFLLPEAGAGAEPGCQRERYAELNETCDGGLFVRVGAICYYSIS